MQEVRHLPPQSIEAEMSVLGAILLDNDSIGTAHELLKVDDFFKQPHRVIFDCMATMSDKGEAIDLITLSAALKVGGKLAEVGGAAYLSELSDYVPTSANIAHYCKIVANKAGARRLLEHAQNTVGMIYDDKPLEEVSEHWGSVEVEERKNNSPVSSGVILRDLIKTIEHRYENTGEVQGIPYGIPELDGLTNGMKRGDLIIVAGRPSMGKSALAGNIVESVCNAGEVALFFSLEMSRDEVMERFISSVGRVRYDNIQSGRVQDHEWDRMMKASGKIDQWPLFIDDTPAISLREMSAKAKKLSKQGRLGMIGVDYIQLMTPPPKKDSREQEISALSRGLKQLAREMDCPVVALSQLNRLVDSRAEKRPIMSDLRESGALEQDADVILFPFRPAAYCQQCRTKEDTHDHDYKEHQTKAEIIIEKQRKGPKNVAVPVAWVGEYQKFYGVEKQY